ERIAGLQADDRGQVHGGDRAVAVDGERVDDVARAARDGEANGELARHLLAHVHRRGVTVAAGMEVVFDRAARVLEQVLVRRRFRANRYQPVPVRFGYRVARERHRDVRPAIDHDAYHGAAAGKVIDVRGASFVEATGAQRRLVLVQLRVDGGG